MARTTAAEDDGGVDVSDFDFGADDDHSISVMLRGDAGDPVRFSASHSPYLAELLNSGELQPSCTHQMLVSHDALKACSDFCAAHYSHDSHAHHRVAEAEDIVRRVQSIPALVEATAWVAHLLRVKVLFDRLALAFGANVRRATPPYGFKMRAMVEHANIIRLAVGLPARDKIPEEEHRWFSLYFFTEIAHGTQSMAPAAAAQSNLLTNVDTVLETSAARASLNPFIAPDWQKDEEVLACPDCKRAFGWAMTSWVQRSHCRVCARVKCKECVKYPAPPRFARPFKDGEDVTKLKCCKGCHDKHSHFQRRQFLVQLVSSSGLSMWDVACLQLAGGEYLETAQTVLYDVRQGFITGELSPSRESLVKASRHLAGGHTQLLWCLIRATDWGNQAEAMDTVAALRATVAVARGEATVSHSHWHMLCNRACTEPMFDLLALHALRALNSIPSSKGPWIDECRAVAQQLFVETVDKPTAVATCATAGMSPLSDRERCGSGAQRDDETMRAAWIPTLLDLLHQDPTQQSVECVCSILLTLCSQSANLSMQVYRELVPRHMFAKPHHRQFFDSLRSAVEQQSVIVSELLIRVTSFISLLEDTRSETEHDVPQVMLTALQKFQFTQATAVDATGIVPIEPMPYLFDPSVLIQGIAVADIKIMASKQRPWLIPLVSTTGARFTIIFKREDVRKDYVVCNAVAAFENFLLARGHITHRIKRYRVLPTSAGSGIIQVVPDTVTVESLVGTYRDKPMFSWLSMKTSSSGGSGGPVPPLTATVPAAPAAIMKQPSPTPPVTALVTESDKERFKQTFLDSACFYLFVTYLLGIRDRHRGNVLLCERSGSMCHIDFGFVLGADTLFESMTSQFVRYDDDLRQVIEWCYVGKSAARAKTPAEKRQQFLSATADILLAVRPHIAFVRVLLDHWVTHGIATGAQLDSVLANRTFPTLNDRDAREKMIHRIENSFGQAWLPDAAHDMNIMMRGADGVASVVGRGVASLFGW